MGRVATSLSVTLASLAVAAVGAVERQYKRPNFVFFFPDTLRAESFGSYGAPPLNKKLNVTPHFDKFAETGTLFEQAHVMHSAPRGLYTYSPRIWGGEIRVSKNKWR